MKTQTKSFCLKNLSGYPTIPWSKMGWFFFPCAAPSWATITLHPGAEKWVACTMLWPAKEKAWRVIILNETFCCGSVHHTVWTLDSTSEKTLTWFQTSLQCLTYFESSSCKSSLKNGTDTKTCNLPFKSFRKQPFLPSNSIFAALKTYKSNVKIMSAWLNYPSK